MTYFHPSNFVWKAASKDVRPLIKLASRRNSAAEKAAVSSVVSLTLSQTLKIRVSLKTGREKTSRAPITICMTDKWPVKATYCK